MEPLEPTRDDAQVQAILGDAASSPKVALMALSVELDRELRRLAAATGWARGQSSSRGILRALPEGIPDHLKDVIDQFWQIRTRIVHGAPAPDADAPRALDSGLAILHAVQEIPHEKFIGRHLRDV
jgi:hypothetical protein